MEKRNLCGAYNSYMCLSVFILRGISLQLCRFLMIFYFEIMFDFQKNCKDCTEGSCILFVQFFLLLTFHISMVPLSKLRNWPWYIIFQANYSFSFNFTSFPINVPGPKSTTPHCISFLCLLSLLWSLTVS